MDKNEAKALEAIREMLGCLEEAEESMGFPDGEMRKLFRETIADEAKRLGFGGTENARKIEAWILGEAEDFPADVER